MNLISRFTSIVALLTACTAEPFGLRANTEDRSDEPIFDATAAAKPTGAVIINTMVDFDPRPVHGTFEVVAGSGLLGCAAGTFVDQPAGGFGIAIRKTFTCTDEGTGSFTFNFTPVIFVSPGVFRGHWNVLVPRSTGDFVGLGGQGDFSVVFTGPLEGEEALTGTIRFVP